MHDSTEIVERVRVSDLDFVFISYDEPDCEANWSETLHRVPWAKRVHGVTGFDAAHKAAAMAARTDRLITVDGDSIPDEGILDRVLNIRAGIRDHVFSWRAKNVLNGLCYGNGSLKCWPRRVMMNMHTHEVASGDTGAVDFCWSIPYTHMRTCCSTTNPGGSPYQAFRSGFREGIKTALDRGEPVPPESMIARLWSGSIQRIQTWCGVGADTEHGLWAIYGARCGLMVMMTYPSPEYRRIADYDWFESMFDEKVAAVGGWFEDSHRHSPIRVHRERLVEEIEKLAGPILARSGIRLCLFDPDQSVLVRAMIDPAIMAGRGFDPMVEE